MHASVRSLLTRIIDFAGTFPPANLPLEQAIRNFGQYLQEPEGWMLGRFVCPADRLHEIVPAVQELTLPDRTISFSVLGRGGQDAQEFIRNVEADLADVQTFAGACPGLVLYESYEVKLPAPLFDPIKANQIGATIATLAYLIEKSGIALSPFLEVPAPGRDNVQALMTALVEDQHSAEAAQRQLVPRCGLKLRTGGQPADIPAPDLVAAVLAGCRKTRVPFKATAGLHHAFRHFDPAVQAKMHGFINVFVAGCLSLAFDLPVDELQAVLEEEEKRNFVPDEGGISWKTYRVTTEQIDQARKELFHSFGSCSFDEPREDLWKYSWLK